MFDYVSTNCSCDIPFCLDDNIKFWQELACCSSANDLAAAIDFDHVDDGLVLDGCGFDGNVFVPANVVGGVVERLFAQP